MHFAYLRYMLFLFDIHKYRVKFYISRPQYLTTLKYIADLCDDKASMLNLPKHRD